MRLLPITLFALSSLAPAAELQVGADHELTTISAARDAVRTLRSGGESGNIDVIIQDGIYRLDETLIFGLEDSAPEGSTTRYRAADGARPILSGGRIITGWFKPDQFPDRLSAAARDHVWVAPVSWATGTHRFHCLFNDDALLPRAKSPSFTIPGKPARKYANDMALRSEFSFQEGLKNWPNLDDIELFLSPQRKWLVNYLPLAEVDEAAGTAKVAVPATYTIAGSFVVENCLDYLDSPGEWVLDTQEGLLYYWPETDAEPGENIVAPYLDEVLRVAGSNDADVEGSGDRPVTGLVFQGVTFAHADRQRWEPEDRGLQHDWNMWNKANGLLRFDGASDCLVLDCTFRDSGSDGLRLDRYAQHIIVKNCTFTRLGGTAILMAGYGPGLKDVNHHNEVVDNDLHNVGLLFWHSPGIFIWQSGHNRIAHNHVYDQGYSGIIISGVRRRFFVPMHQEDEFDFWHFPRENREHSATIRWDEISNKVGLDWADYEPYMHARKNVIEFNEVHDCLKLLHDGNGIYLSGHGDGNIVRYNVTYNHPEGAMIRSDDDSHGCLVTGNLAISTSGMQGITMKGLNTVTDNILINGCLLTGRAGNTADPVSVLKRNVFYHTNSKLVQGFHYGIDHMGAGLDANVYWHQKEGVAGKMLALLRERGEGNDAASVAADPMFVDPLHGDFSFRPGSPAVALGIHPLPRDVVRRMGRSGDRFIDRFAAGLPLYPEHLEEQVPAITKKRAKKAAPAKQNELDL